MAACRVVLVLLLSLVSTACVAFQARPNRPLARRRVLLSMDSASSKSRVLRGGLASASRDESDPALVQGDVAPAARRRNAGARNPMFGRTHSLLVRTQLSRANLGQNNPFYGRRHSDETRRTIAHKLRLSHARRRAAREAAATAEAGARAAQEHGTPTSTSTPTPARTSARAPLGRRTDLTAFNALADELRAFIAANGTEGHMPTVIALKAARRYDIVTSVHAPP